MKNPVAFLLLELVAWVMVVGGWPNMDCETGGGARILAYGRTCDFHHGYDCELRGQWRWLRQLKQPP